MTDVTALTALLTDYAGALDAHLATLREQFSDLERAWAGLAEVYEGSAAEQFGRVFLGTASRMQQYEHDATILLGVLRERIGTLERLDAPE
jgi:uncharacterized protein YukE